MVRNCISTEGEHMLRKSGSIIRSGPNELSFNSYSCMREIYKNTAAVGKPDIWQALSASRRTPNILSSVDDSTHRFKRQTISKMFTGRYMKQVEDCVSYHSKVFVTQLAKPGPRFELQELCDWLSFDVISDLLYGQSCDMLQNSRLRWIPEAYKVMSRRSMIVCSSTRI